MQNIVPVLQKEMNMNGMLVTHWVRRGCPHRWPAEPAPASWAPAERRHSPLRLDPQHTGWSEQAGIAHLVIKHIYSKIKSLEIKAPLNLFKSDLFIIMSLTWTSCISVVQLIIMGEGGGSQTARRKSIVPYTVCVSDRDKRRKCGKSSFPLLRT